MGPVRGWLTWAGLSSLAGLTFQFGHPAWEVPSPSSSAAPPLLLRGMFPKIFSVFGHDVGLAHFLAFITCHVLGQIDSTLVPGRSWGETLPHSLGSQNPTKSTNREHGVHSRPNMGIRNSPALQEREAVSPFPFPSLLTLSVHPRPSPARLGEAGGLGKGPPGTGVHTPAIFASSADFSWPREEDGTTSQGVRTEERGFWSDLQA